MRESAVDRLLIAIGAGLSEIAVLPCGCVCGKRIEEERKEFVMVPCSTSCKRFLYAQNETARQRKPFEIRFTGATSPQ